MNTVFVRMGRYENIEDQRKMAKCQNCKVLTRSLRINKVVDHFGYELPVYTMQRK